MFASHLYLSLNNMNKYIWLKYFDTHIFPKGVVHRVESGWGLTKVAVVLLNGLQW